MCRRKVCYFSRKIGAGIIRGLIKQQSLCSIWSVLINAIGIQLARPSTGTILHYGQERLSSRITAWIIQIYRTIIAIRKHISPNESLPCTLITVGINESPVCGIIITGLQVIEPCLITDSNLNHTGIYLYSKGKIMIHLTFDYKTDEKCTTPGQYLKYHRTFQGLSTRELAEKVGIVPATLVLYENDRHPIKHSTAVALANALGIDRNRLLDKYTAFVDYPYSSLLKKVRQDLSLTQIQMAELIGIGQTSYSGWEREIRVPRRKEYDKILAALEKLRVNVDTYLCQSASI